MKRKVVSGILLTLLLIGMLTLSFNIMPVLTELEEWLPYVPNPDRVDLTFWMKNHVAYIKVCITFSDAGYNVSDWGDVVKDGYELWADSEIWDWTGPAALVITELCYTYDLGQLEAGTYTFTFKAWGFPIKSISFTVTRLLATAVNIVPGTLNLRSEGQWITCYIELPEGCDVSDIDVSSIMLSNTIPMDSAALTQIGDYDEDGIPDLMVEFDRAAVAKHIRCDLNITYGDVLLSVTGNLTSGTPFEGTDTIRVIFAGDVNHDGIINIIDLSMLGGVWGTVKENLDYNPNVDFNNDGKINLIDLAILSTNWGAEDPYSLMTA